MSYDPTPEEAELFQRLVLYVNSQSMADGLCPMMKLKDHVPCIYHRNFVIGQLEFDLAGQTIVFAAVNTYLTGYVFYFVVAQTWNVPRFDHHPTPSPNFVVEGSAEDFSRDMLYVKMLSFD